MADIVQGGQHAETAGVLKKVTWNVDGTRLTLELLEEDHESNFVQMREQIRVFYGDYNA